MTTFKTALNGPMQQRFSAKVQKVFPGYAFTAAPSGDHADYLHSLIRLIVLLPLLEMQAMPISE